MINVLLNLVAPHHCFECAKIGTLLCANCKYDIVSEPFSQCLQCLVPTGETALCHSCSSDLYDKAWCAGERRDALQAVIDSYKVANLKDAASVLGEILAATLPEMPANLQIVPIPTIAPHIRRRGYDHTQLMATSLQRQSGGHVIPLLKRRTQTVQRGANRAERLRQARAAFRLNKRLAIDYRAPHLIVDDVFTTGATINAAAQLLRDVGVTTIWVAVATREPLD